MSPQRIDVLGEQVEFQVTSAETGGSFCALIQTSPPGGGPPPHQHRDEDELFTVVEGEFEIFDGQTWKPLPAGQTAYALRGQTHTFRNCGSVPGKILCVAVPGAFENYLRAISPLQLPADGEELQRISSSWGITFLPPSA